ncbi:MAG: disulfide bond formation protein B [Geminicoccaceae bacterium]|nr:disulfide bond formation protein B [Geminicoccaceae bacterium]
MIRHALVLAGLFAALALGFAWLLQFGFGFAPCELCLWQRYPYVAILLLALLGLLTGWTRTALGLVIAAFAVDAAIAWYHGGVEAGLFALPQSCGAIGRASTIEELRAQLTQAAPACDQVGWTFLGLSLSVWNALAATSMTALLLAVLLSRAGR